MARRLNYGNESRSTPAVVVQCSYAGCPDKAITREYDDKPICRRHYDIRCNQRDSIEMKRLDLVTLAEKRDYCSKLVRSLSDHFTGEPNTDWATRILQRMEDGENISILQERMAKNALGIPL